MGGGKKCSSIVWHGYTSGKFLNSNSYLDVWRQSGSDFQMHVPANHKKMQTRTLIFVTINELLYF